MNNSRRLFLKLASITMMALTTGFTLFRSLPVFAERNDDAFSAESLDEALAEFYPGEQITSSDQINIDAHDLVENGAYVPVSITSTLPEVNSISVFVEKNPNPLIANFNLGPHARPFIATRIKMAEPSNVIIVIRSGGKLFKQQKFIEVVAGGCGS